MTLPTERTRPPLDYRLLQALDAVVAEQGFERAARRLHLTQSAISQRIRQLEEQMAQPLLIRGTPLQATPAGQALLVHFRQIHQLEQALWPQLQPDAPQQPLAVSIAVNADSLATWLLPALAPLLGDHPIALNLVVDDETRTHLRLRQGEVFAAICCQKNPLPGCHSTLLGDMAYQLVCAPGFAQRYFADGLHAGTLNRAPAVAFDPHDDMHVSYLRQHFQLEPGGYPCHTVRSSEAFIALAGAGAAYCLIPALQIRDQVARGELVVLPAPTLTRRLYWQRWQLECGIHRQISEAVLQCARQQLTAAI